jgi:hypothetical protein
MTTTPWKAIWPSVLVVGVAFPSACSIDQVPPEPTFPTPVTTAPSPPSLGGSGSQCLTASQFGATCAHDADCPTITPTCDRGCCALIVRASEGDDASPSATGAADAGGGDASPPSSESPAEPPATSCLTALDCPGGPCQAGVCLPPGSTAPCATSLDCGSGSSCNDGICTLVGSCVSDFDCASGHCAAGICI